MTPSKAINARINIHKEQPMTKPKPEMTLILSDARGMYLPRDFTNTVARERVTGVTDEDWATLAAGPENTDYDHRDYWDAWQEVEQNARVTDDNGNTYFIWNDSDCWLVPTGWEWSDEEDTFVEPKEERYDERI
jgi:hypothetical protein